MLGFPHAVTVLRAEKRADGQGQPVEQRDWATATSRTLRGVNVQPFSSSQAMRNDARQVTTQWRLITRPGRGDVDLTIGDHVVFAGRPLTVVAEPMRWPSLRGGVDHVEAILQDAPPVEAGGGASTGGVLHDQVVGAGVGRGWRP